MGGHKVQGDGLRHVGDDLPESAWAGERLLGATMEREAAPKRLAAFLCGGKLKSLSEVADGGLDEFVRDVADAQKRFSAPGTAGKRCLAASDPEAFHQPPRRRLDRRCAREHLQGRDRQRLRKHRNPPRLEHKAERL
jgi:hypothetical protein